MTRDEHARYEELAAGYALNALEPGDEEAFLAHLPSCAACERALAQHLETAAHLAYAADPVALPDELLGRIRADVAASGRAVAPPEPVVSLEDARTRRRPAQSRAWIGAAAAAVLVMSLLTWNLALLQDRSQTQQRTDQLTAAVNLLTHGRQVSLADASGRAVATAVMQDSTVSLVIDGLPANDRSSSTYVLWQTGATGTRPVGAFDVHAGRIDLVRDLPLVTTLKGWTALAVTKEPGRTAPAVPGSNPVATGTLTA